MVGISGNHIRVKNRDGKWTLNTYNQKRFVVARFKYSYSMMHISNPIGGGLTICCLYRNENNFIHTRNDLKEDASNLMATTGTRYHFHVCRYAGPKPNSKSLTGGIKLTWGCRTGPPGYIGWQAGTSTLCRSQLYRYPGTPPFRDYEFDYWIQRKKFILNKNRGSGKKVELGTLFVSLPARRPDRYPPHRVGPGMTCCPCRALSWWS